MAYSNKRYGKARIIGGARIVRVFESRDAAMAWHKRVTEEWRRVFVTEAMVYIDEDCTRPILQGFDMLRFRCDCEDYGLHKAYAWANEGKYGIEGMPEMLKRPERCEDTTV
jgi:hypothetical protein